MSQLCCGIEDQLTKWTAKSSLTMWVRFMTQKGTTLKQHCNCYFHLFTTLAFYLPYIRIYTCQGVWLFKGGSCYYFKLLFG